MGVVLYCIEILSGLYGWGVGKLWCGEDYESILDVIWGEGLGDRVLWLVFVRVGGFVLLGMVDLFCVFYILGVLFWRGEEVVVLGGFEWVFEVWVVYLFWGELVVVWVGVEEELVNFRGKRVVFVFFFCVWKLLKFY